MQNLYVRQLFDMNQNKVLIPNRDYPFGLSGYTHADIEATRSEILI